MTTTLALLAYLRGLIPLDTLPDTLTFDDALWQAMDDLWQRSIARIDEGIVVKWGGDVLTMNKQKEKHMYLLNIWGNAVLKGLGRVTQRASAG